jgi:hypothetical protein
MRKVTVILDPETGNAYVFRESQWGIREIEEWLAKKYPDHYAAYLDEEGDMEGIWFTEYLANHDEEPIYVVGDVLVR